MEALFFSSARSYSRCVRNSTNARPVGRLLPFYQGHTKEKERKKETRKGKEDKEEEVRATDRKLLFLSLCRTQREFLLFFLSSSFSPLLSFTLAVFPTLSLYLSYSPRPSTLSSHPYCTRTQTRLSATLRPFCSTRSLRPCFTSPSSAVYPVYTLLSTSSALAVVSKPTRLIIRFLRLCIPKRIVGRS